MITLICFGVTTICMKETLKALCIMTYVLSDDDDGEEAKMIIQTDCPISCTASCKIILP